MAIQPNAILIQCGGTEPRSGVGSYTSVDIKTQNRPQMSYLSLLRARTVVLKLHKTVAREKILWGAFIASNRASILGCS